jgi:hypothetical protein
VGRIRTKPRLLGCGALVALLALAGCGSDSGDSAQVNHEPPGLLFVQPATGGTLERGGNGIKLTLSGIDPSTIFFSDRPERIAGQLPNAAFVDMWDGAGFKANPPNAALTISGAPPSADVFVVELSDPRLVGGRDGISYTATPVNKVGITSAEERMDPLRNAPGSFQNASLLIDDVPAAATTAATAQKLTATASSLPDSTGNAKLDSLVSSLQAKAQAVGPLTSQLQQGQPPQGSVLSFEQLIASLATYVSQVNAQVQQLQQGQSGSVDLSTMFQLQFRMQVMSQYIEAVSNTLSAVHQEMMSMARATKGQ